MGWRTDWLYRLVFYELTEQWHRAQTAASERPHADERPDHMLVQQCDRVDVERALCIVPVRRTWSLDANGVRESGALPLPLDVDGPSPSHAEAPGLFYRQARARFHLTSDRRRVVVTTVFGPRYGRGLVFSVHGQGRRGRLSLCGAGWVA
jgi:hypothetical protein